MSVKITGNTDGLKKLAANIKKLENQKQVEFGEIVSKEFIQKHTDFESLDDLFEKAGFKVLTIEDFEAIPQESIDSFINQKTKFKDFSDLQTQAAAEYVQKQLFKDLK